MSNPAAASVAQARIHVTVSPYEGDDFPESARWASYAQAAISDANPGAIVEVEEGRENRVHAYDANGQPDDDTSTDVLSSLTDLWAEFCAHGYREAGPSDGDAPSVAPRMAYITTSLGEPSTCVETAGALDYDVTLRIGDDGAEVDGAVTLCPDEDARNPGMVTWGELENWLSSSLVAVVRSLGKATGRQLADAIAAACVGDDILITVELEGESAEDAADLGGEGVGL